MVGRGINSLTIALVIGIHVGVGAARTRTRGQVREARGRIQNAVTARSSTYWATRRYRRSRALLRGTRIVRFR
ncbi:hypothetical protein B0H13DRAFT_2020736 [Mycena leptocephala]|nr:hypothetical protein B0H13DRAFT_2020736 [Mycena leptocephala]